MSDTPETSASATTELGEQPSDAPLASRVWPPAPRGYETDRLSGFSSIYRSPVPLSRKTNWWIVFWIISLGLRFAFDVVKSGHPGSMAAEIASGTATLMDEVASTGVMILYLRWIYRIVANLKALGATGVSASPGWAVGWYFIPIFGFFRPYQIMQEVWRACTPRVDMQSDPLAWHQEHRGPIVKWWWASFLFCYLLMPIFVFWLIFFSGISVSNTELELGIDVLITLQNIMTMRLVSMVTARQEVAAMCSREGQPIS